MTEVSTSQIINGWEVARGEDGILVIRPAYGSPPREPLIRIERESITISRPGGMSSLHDKDLCDALRSLLLNQENRLYSHRFAKMAMWEQLFAKFANAEPVEHPNPAYWAAREADAHMEEWEAKRKKLGLTFETEET